MLKGCIIKNCKNDIHCKGICHKHYSRLIRLGKTSLPKRPIKLCQKKNCKNKFLAKELCSKHWAEQYRNNNREYVRERTRKYESTHPEIMKRKRKRYYIKHRKKILKKGRKQAKTPEAKKKKKIYRSKKKIKVLTYYSKRKRPTCIGCNEKEIKILSLDHIKNDGKEHRKTLSGDGTGEVIYDWIIKNNFPKGFQTLCMNCQWKKRFNLPLANTYKRHNNKKK